MTGPAGNGGNEASLGMGEKPQCPKPPLPGAAHMATTGNPCHHRQSQAGKDTAATIGSGLQSFPNVGHTFEVVVGSSQNDSHTGNAQERDLEHGNSKLTEPKLLLLGQASPLHPVVGWCQQRATSRGCVTKGGRGVLLTSSSQKSWTPAGRT